MAGSAGGRLTRALGGLRSTRRVALAAALAAVLGTVTLLAVTGAREPADAVRLLSGDAWLSNTRTGSISHVDGYSAKADALVGVARPGDPFTIVQRPDGAYVLDLRTGRLTRVSSDSLATVGSRVLPGQPSALQIITTGATTWALDRSSGILQRLDPSTLASVGAQLALGAATGTAVADGAGDIWIPIPSKAAVDEVGPGGHITSQPVGQANDDVQLAVTSAGVWAVDPQAGQARSLSEPNEPPVVLAQTPSGQAAVVGSEPGSDHFAVVQGGQLTDVDATGGAPASTTAPDFAQVTQAALVGETAYLLDAAADRLAVVPLDPLASAPPIQVPPGSNQLLSQDNLLFVNATGSPSAVVVNSNGQVTPIIKYVPPAPSTGSGPSQIGTVPATPSSSQAGGYPVSQGAPTGLSAPAPTSSPTPATIPPTTPTSSPPVYKHAPNASSSTTAAPIAVPDLEGLTPDAACSKLSSSSSPLTCSRQDLGQAPAGVKAGVVNKQNPQAGTDVAVGSTVTISSYATLAVPAPQANESPAAYCNRLKAVGLGCTPSNQGQGAPGRQANVVFETSPGTGAVVAAGTSVKADFYGSALPATVPVPTCSTGTPVQGCPKEAGLTWNYQPVSIAEDVTANTVYQQVTPAGSTVPYGGSATVYYDPYAAVPFAEYHEAGTNTYYLTTGSAPSGFVPETVAGAAYPVSNGACAKAGTEPVYEYEYASTGKSSGGYTHYYFTTNGSFADPGWSGQTAIACVFSQPVAGSEAVYAHYINPGKTPGDYSWELQPGNGATVVWYQPKQAG